MSPSSLCINVKSASLNKLLRLMSPPVGVFFNQASILVPVWATSSVWGVSVWTCRWMRMFPQHFFTKDPYLWTMLCLCCKLALPTTPLCELIFLFLMNHVQVWLKWIGNHCCHHVWDFILFRIYIFQISIVSFDISLLFTLFIFFFLHELWKIFLHFNPEFKHLLWGNCFFLFCHS